MFCYVALKKLIYVSDFKLELGLIFNFFVLFRVPSLAPYEKHIAIKICWCINFFINMTILKISSRFGLFFPN